MAVQNVSDSPSEEPRTHPVIQCIIDDNMEELKKLLKNNNINSQYPSEIWEDAVTPLIASVKCKNEYVFSYLLKNSADVNAVSAHGLSALQYAADECGVPLTIVERLLQEKAEPNYSAGGTSPLEFAVNHKRADIVKALIEAGAKVERDCGKSTMILKKMIRDLSSQSKDFIIVEVFFSCFCSIIQQDQNVFEQYQKFFLLENPFTHNVLFETYFQEFPPVLESGFYCDSGFKWLKDTNNAVRYIKGFIQRFQKIPLPNRSIAINGLCFALSACESITHVMSSELLTTLSKSLSEFSQIPESSVIFDGSLKVKVTLLKTILKNIEEIVFKTTVKTLEPCVEGKKLNSEEIMWAYEQFGHIDKFVPECVISKTFEDGTSNVSLNKSGYLHNQTAMESAEPIQEEVGLPEVSQQANKEADITEPSVEVTNLPVQPLIGDQDNKTRKHKVSRRWSDKLDKLINMPENKIYTVKNLKMVLDDEFQIAKGSEGTQVFLGLRHDETEVAIKRMIKSHYQMLKNEQVFLRLLELYNSSIVRYVDFAEDEHFGYLALQLCECTLEEHIKEMKTPAENTQEVCKKLAVDILKSLTVLHNSQTKILHRDIKPQNVLIDIHGSARLADFGISRRLNEDQTTLHTGTAGTKCWMPVETLIKDRITGYKRSSDIQVAGMLLYYILSRGHHPFGEGPHCEANISDGAYSLHHLNDEVAKNLIERMIKKDQIERPTVEQALAHPFFWADERKMEYIRKCGNQKEVEHYNNLSKKLRKAITKWTEGKCFSEWKSKFPEDVVKKLDSYNTKHPYSENILSLLRFVRNLHEHHPSDAENIDLMAIFPDLFGTVFMLAEEQGWNSGVNLKKFFQNTL